MFGILLLLAGVVIIFLGPIAFLLTIDVRGRIQIAERKILALEAQLRVAQGLLGAGPARQTAEPPSAQPEQAQEIKPEDEWEAGGENDRVVETESPSPRAQ